VALLAIAGLVVTRPKAGTAVAARSPGAGVSSPSGGNSASSSPSPGSGSGGSGAVGSSSPSAAVSPPTSAAPPPTTGTNLFTQDPVQVNDASVTDWAAQIGNTSYPDSVRFTCNTGVESATSLVYDVAGFAFLNATLGVPSNATNAAGNTMNVTFFKDGSTDQLGKTITVSLDNPVPLHLSLGGAPQLAIESAPPRTVPPTLRCRWTSRSATPCSPRPEPAPGAARLGGTGRGVCRVRSGAPAVERYRPKGRNHHAINGVRERERPGPAHLGAGQARV
jgi:hypothetical protein